MHIFTQISHSGCTGRPFCTLQRVGRRRIFLAAPAGRRDLQCMSSSALARSDGPANALHPSVARTAVDCWVRGDGDMTMARDG